MQYQKVMNYKSTKNKIRYCLEKAPGLSDRELVVSIWQTFYSDRLKDGYIYLHDAVELPSLRDVRSARRSLDRPKEKTVRDYQPYWA